MEGIEAWAGENKQRPKRRQNSDEWFAERPAVAQEGREAYAKGWSWRQIRDYFAARYGYPFADEKSVSRNCQ